MADLTEGELLQALQAALQEAQQAEAEGADGALTARELTDVLGWYSGRVHRWLRTLKDQGKLEVIKVHREAVDGSSRVSPAYRLLVDPPEAEAEV